MLLNRVNSHRRAVIDESDGCDVVQNTIYERLDYIRSTALQHRETSQVELDKSHESEHEEQTAKENFDTNCQLQHCYPSIPFYGVMDSISIVIKPCTAGDNRINENTSNPCHSTSKQLSGHVINSLCERWHKENLEKSIALQRVLDKLAQKHGNVYYLHCVCDSEETAHARKRAREENKNVNNTIANGFINYAEGKRSLFENDVNVSINNKKRELFNTNTIFKYTSNNNANAIAQNMEINPSERVPEELCKSNLISQSLCPLSSLSYHEYIATMHESIGKMMQLRMNVSLFNKMKTRKEVTSLSLERREENEEYEYELNVELDNKKNKELVNYCTHHTITWSLSNHARWKDIIALLAIENERLILFIYASSRTTQQYLNNQMMRITHTELCWIERATLLEEPRAVQKTDSNPVVIMWTLLTHLPLASAKVQFQNEEAQLQRSEYSSLPFSSPSSSSTLSPFLPLGVISKYENNDSRMKHQEKRNNNNNDINNKVLWCETNKEHWERQESLDVGRRNFVNGHQSNDRIEPNSNTNTNNCRESKFANVLFLESDKQLHNNFDANSNSHAKLYEEDIANELLMNHFQEIENVNLTLLSSIPLTFTSCCTPAFRFRHKRSLSRVGNEMNSHRKSNLDRGELDNNYELEWQSVGSRALILPHFFAKLLSCLIEEVKLNDFEIQCNYDKAKISTRPGLRELAKANNNLQFNTVYTNRKNANTNEFVNVIAPQAPFTKASLSNKSKNSTSLYEKITRLSSLTWLEFINEQQRALIKEQIIDYMGDAGYEGDYSNSQVRETECEFLLHKLQFHRDYFSDNGTYKDTINKKPLNNSAHNNRGVNNVIPCVRNNETENEYQPNNCKQFEQKNSQYDDDDDDAACANDNSDSLVCTDNWGAHFKFDIEIIRIIQENVEDEEADENKSIESKQKK